MRCDGLRFSPWRNMALNGTIWHSTKRCYAMILQGMKARPVFATMLTQA
jgi:hypothetical protein